MPALQYYAYAKVFIRAKVDGCILGKNTKVGAKADITKCITQAGYEVSAGGKLPLYCSVLVLIAQKR